MDKLFSFKTFSGYRFFLWLAPFFFCAKPVSVRLPSCSYPVQLACFYIPFKKPRMWSLSFFVIVFYSWSVYNVVFSVFVIGNLDMNTLYWTVLGLKRRSLVESRKERKLTVVDFVYVPFFSECLYLWWRVRHCAFDGKKIRRRMFSVIILIIVSFESLLSYIIKNFS